MDSEVFPPNYRAYRNDRGTLGGVFVLIHEDLVSSEQPEFVTAREIAWAKIQIHGHRDLFIASYHMPHREHKHSDQLDASLQQLSDKSRNFIICGDFNCSDVDWETGTVPPGASERPVQEKLVELSLKHHLSQIHELPTGQGSHLDLVFTTNALPYQSLSQYPWPLRP